MASKMNKSGNSIEKVTLTRKQIEVGKQLTSIVGNSKLAGVRRVEG